MINYRIFILLSGIIAASTVVSEVYAQENVLLHPDKFYRKYFPHMRIKRDPPDSLYVKLYTNYLSADAHMLLPAIYMNITSRESGASLKFKTNINDVIGFNVSYRNVNAGFAFLTKPLMLKRPGYAPTSYHTATVNYNGTLYSFQFKYLKLLGMTDTNTPGENNDPYTKRSDISLKEFHFESLLNFSWRKYAYHAPLDFSQRQIKSRGGFLVKAGVYYSELLSDSNLVSKGQQQHFENFNDTRGIRRFSVRLAPGLGGTQVFKKRFYVAAAFFLCNDLYFYRYVNSDNTTTSKKERFVWGLDGYASVGFQSKRFYAGLKYEVNGSQAMLQGIQLNIFYSYVGVTLGYRFNTPTVVRKFYKKTMPPGM